MKKNRIFLAFLFLLSIFGGRAQTLVPNAPKTEIGDESSVELISEDDNYLYFCAVDIGSSYNDLDDDTYITVYDKKKHSVVKEHEIDEDFLFRTAYKQDDNMVLLGYNFNKKTKSFDYFQSSFPIMEKTPRKFVKTTVHSVPAINSTILNANIVWSPDRSKMAFVTILRPTNRKLNNYTIDVKVCAVDGATLMQIQQQMNGTPPSIDNCFLTNDATTYIVEKRKPEDITEEELGLEIITKYWTYRYLTITSDGTFAPKTIVESQLIKPIVNLMPNNNLIFFSETPTGVATFELDHNGEISTMHDYEIEIPKEPKGVTFQNHEEGLLFNPLQILPLSDGRIMVLGTQYKSQTGSTDRYYYTYYIYQCLNLFLLDNNEQVTTQVLPYACQYGTIDPSDLMIEWDGDVWLLYNGNKENYGGKKAPKWKTLRKMEEHCIVIGKLDENLNVEYTLLYSPNNNYYAREYLMEVLDISDEAVYFLKHRTGDNQIEKIIK